MLNPTSFLRSTVMESVKKAAGVVQTTKSATIAIKTKTNMRSSGLCNPRRLVEERFGVLRVFKMRALVTLPLRPVLAGVSPDADEAPSTTVKAVVVVF